MFDNQSLPPISCLKQSPLNKVRCDKFILHINIPLLLRRELVSAYGDSSIIDTFQVNLTNSPFTGVSIPSIEVPFGGQVYNASSHFRPKYADLDINFYIDTKFLNYWLLWNWLNLSNDIQTAGNYIISDTVTNFVLDCLDEYNSTIIKVIYEDVSITALGAFSLDYADSKELKASAKFVYNRMHLRYPEA